MYDSMVALLSAYVLCMCCVCVVSVLCLCCVCVVSVSLCVCLSICLFSCLVLVWSSCSCLGLAWVLFGLCLGCDTSGMSLGVFLFDSLIGAWLVSGLLLDDYELAIVCSMSLMSLCCCCWWGEEEEEGGVSIDMNRTERMTMRLPIYAFADDDLRRQRTQVSGGRKLRSLEVLKISQLG